MRRGEVWWINFDPSIGSEIKKKRPAIIVSNNHANDFLTRIQVIPVTSNIAKLYPSETFIYIKAKKSKALGDQISTVSKLRVGSFICKLSKQEMDDVDKVIRMQLGLNKELLKIK